MFNSNYFDMDTQLMHIPSGAVYANRRDAKMMMGHTSYNKALRRREMLFLSMYEPSDIII